MMAVSKRLAGAERSRDGCWDVAVVEMERPGWMQGILEAKEGELAVGLNVGRVEEREIRDKP